MSAKSTSPCFVVGISAWKADAEQLVAFFKNLKASKSYLFLNMSLTDSELEVFAQKIPQSVERAPSQFEPEAGKVYLIAEGGSAQQSELGFHVKYEKGGAKGDSFLQNLAEIFGDQCIGILFGQVAGQGLSGLRAINARGGLTLVHDEAQSLPSIIVDHKLSSIGLAEQILRYEGHYKKSIDSSDQQINKEVGAAIHCICDILQKVTTHDFRHYKKSTLIRRILRRMQVHRITEVDAYVDYLKEHGTEVENLFRELLINVTSFFRDPEAFEALKSKVLPELISSKNSSSKIRVWVAGCSTGEEVYSLAILLKEELENLKSSVSFQILATDIDVEAINQARKARYPQSQIETQVSPERIDRFFEKRGAYYFLNRDVRDSCLFTSHNLLSDPPYSNIDLISCRNMLIYLGPHFQKKIFSLFHYSLNEGGYLFLGTSESFSSHKELFRPVDTKYRIAQAKATAVSSSSLVPSMEVGSYNGPHVLTDGGVVTHDLHLITQRIILDEFSPKYVVISDDLQIVSVSSGITRFLDPSEGSFQNNVVKLAKPSLRAALRNSINEAMKHKRRFEHLASSLATKEGVLRVHIIVQPMPQLGQNSSLYLVAFKELGFFAEDEAPLPLVKAELVEQLEDELNTLRNDLDKTVQELEASNEELKSSNEELLSMNEELHSANEELEVSREDVQRYNEALQRSNTDLENLLASTQIATLFLDDNLRVKSFTPAISQIYELLATDIGRPITSFASKVKQMPALPDKGTIVKKGYDEVEIELGDGRTFLRRVLPYKTSEGVQEGIVVAFIDIDDRKQAENQRMQSEGKLVQSQEELKFALKSAMMGTWTISLEDGRLNLSPEAVRILNADSDFDTAEEAIKKLVPEGEQERVQKQLSYCLETGTQYNQEVCILTKEGSPKWIHSTGRAKLDEKGKPIFFSGLLMDITERKVAESHVREYSSLLKTITDNAASCLFMMDKKGHPTFMNPAAMKLTGYESIDEIKDKPLHYAVHWKRPDGSYYPMEECPIDNAQADLVLAQDEEEIFCKKDGTLFPVSYSISPLEKDGEVVGSVLEFRDITAQKAAEQKLFRNQQMLRLALEAGRMGDWELDLVTGQAQRSLRHDQCFGYDEKLAEWTYDIFLKHLHPDDRDYVDSLFKAAVEQTGQWDFECRVFWPDKSLHWISASGRVDFGESGEPVKMAGLVSDITKRKQSEEELEKLLSLEQEARGMAQDSLSKLHAVVHNLSEGMIFAGPGGDIILMNPQALKLHGFKSIDEMGKKVTKYPDLFSLYNFEGTELENSEWPISRVQRGDKFSDYEIEVRRKGWKKSQIWSYAGTPVYDENSKLILAVLTVRDITERRETQKALKEAIRARDEFLSIASHELKTPVTSLKLQMQIIEKQIQRGDMSLFTPESLGSMAKLSIRQTRQLSTLIDDMLDVSRIATGNMTFDFQIWDINQLVKEAFESFAGQIREAGVVADLILTDEFMVKADQHRLEQVFVNLFSNALKYGQGSPVIIEVKKKESDLIEISVADSGPGIAKENLERIFDRFERAISANIVSGLGLGLYVSKTIVLSHGGKIYAESETGRGARFVIELPLSEES